MISIIVAVAANGVIGCENRLIWHISEDLKRFKRLTTGHPVIMGRKTFLSIGKPLPNRHNVVISRDQSLVIEGVTVVNSIDQAIEMFPSGDEIFIIGGGEIYRQTIDRASRLYVTSVDQHPEGDTYFPAIDLENWVIDSSESFDGYTFINYIRS